jgi:hypothetical protein
MILLAFAVHQRRLASLGGAPLLAPALFRQRSVSAGLLTQLAFWCGQASFFLVLALYLQQGRAELAIEALYPANARTAARLLEDIGADLSGSPP